jgi:hypothetical protein
MEKGDLVHDLNDPMKVTNLRNIARNSELSARRIVIEYRQINPNDNGLSLCEFTIPINTTLLPYKPLRTTFPLSFVRKSNNVQ